MAGFCGLLLVILFRPLVTNKAGGQVLHEPKSQENIPLRLDSNRRDLWFDSCRFEYMGGSVSFRGPAILRAREKPVFVWHLQRIEHWGLELSCPYLIVIRDVDGMNVLASLGVGSAGRDPPFIARGGFQGEGESGPFRMYFRYEVELLDTEIGDGRVQENIYFTGEGAVEKSFDLSNGRVFIVDKREGDEFSLYQADFVLPDLRVLREAFLPVADRGELYRRLETWLDDGLKEK